jgi:murein DD-endopeptidase MepM/ murein hydrolase activator NlpD
MVSIMKLLKKSLFIFLPLYLTGCLSQPPAMVEHRGTFYYGEDGVSKYIIVQPGQSLPQVAAENNVSLNDLAKINKISPPYHITNGQSLKLPNEVYHTVKPGENLYSIASMYKVAFPTLAKINRINEPYTVKIGDKLRIPFSNRENAYDSIIQEEVFVDGSQPETHNKSLDQVREEELAPISTNDQLLDQGQDADNNKDAYNDTAFKDLEKDLISKDSKSAALNSPTDVNSSSSSTSSSTSASSFKSSTPLNSEEYSWPVNGEVISRYGETSGKFSEGISISAPANSPVSAASKGEVIYVGNDVEGYGKMVIIKHDNDILTAYAHNSSVLVQKGDVVSKGQPIAKIGKTGDASNSRLYFSIRKGKATIDPELPLGR